MTVWEDSVISECPIEEVMEGVESDSRYIALRNFGRIVVTTLESGKTSVDLIPPGWDHSIWFSVYHVNLSEALQELYEDAHTDLLEVCKLVAGDKRLKNENT